MKKFLSIAVILAIIFSGACNAEESDDESRYLDIYLLSMMSDIRNYILALQMSYLEAKDQKDLLRQALEMKYYDLQMFLPKTNNSRVVESICKAEKTLRDDAMQVSKDCSGDLCVEINNLKEVCMRALEE